MIKRNKNKKIIYIKIFNVIFNIIFITIVVLFVVVKNKIENTLLLILCCSIILIVEKSVYIYWTNSAYSFVLLDDNIVFLYGNKERVFSKNDCIIIREKDSCYIFHFSENKVVLRKEASNFEYKSIVEVNCLNFPHSKIIER